MSFLVPGAQPGVYYDGGGLFSSTSYHHPVQIFLHPWIESRPLHHSFYSFLPGHVPWYILGFDPECSLLHLQSKSIPTWICSGGINNIPLLSSSIPIAWSSHQERALAFAIDAPGLWTHLKLKCDNHCTQCACLLLRSCLFMNHCKLAWSFQTSNSYLAPFR